MPGKSPVLTDEYQLGHNSIIVLTHHLPIFGKADYKAKETK
jgi:hypothetical protein